MKHANYISFIFSVLFFTLTSSLKAVENDAYIYLGQEMSDLSRVVECIKNIDSDNNSPLNKLFVRIKNGFLFEEYEKILEALEYAESILQRDATLASDQLDALMSDFELIIRQFFNGELTVDADIITRAHHLPTLVVDENMNVLGKSVFYEHMKTKQGIHILGKLKVGKNAKFKEDVIIKGTLSAADAIIGSLSVVNLSATDATIINATITNLSVTDLYASNEVIGCDLTVGCNISMNDSISASVGNIIKNGTPFIHNYPGTENNNTFVGINAGNFIQFGIENSAVGSAALQNNIDGNWNSAFGYNALNANTTGSLNVAVGANALANNIGGNWNTALGFNALNANITADSNVAVGNNALLNNTNFGNTAVGAVTLISNTEGYNNVAIGNSAMTGNEIGSSNVAVGTLALSANTSGSNNTALGYNTFAVLTTGNSNIAIGTSVGGTLTTGSENIYIGANTGAISSSESNVTRIANIYNTITGSATTLPVIIDNTGQLGTAPSTRKVKHDIEDMNDLSASIWKLRPVTFAYNSDASETKQYGLIAEEVEEVFPTIVVKDAEGQPLTVQYQVLPVLLLNEMQKQQARFTMIEERLAYLEARL